MDFLHGSWASFDEADEGMARELYEIDGIRLRRCRGIHDDGEVIEGLPLGAERRPRGVS